MKILRMSAMKFIWLLPMPFHGTRLTFALILAGWQGLTFPFQLKAQKDSVAITVHLRGVYESKISVTALSGTNGYNPIGEAYDIKNGETIKLRVSKENLPGDFMLRFDYKGRKESPPSHSEKNIVINDQDIELWVSPMNCNNSDSTWFQQGEKENTAYASFLKDNSRKKEKLGLLQQFLMNYDDTKSKFYLQGIEEHEQRRQAYNQWLDSCAKENKALFVSSLYQFQYIPKISWEGTEKDRILNVISHYFDGIDFKDPNITKTSQLNVWMDSYVNLHVQMITSMDIRDSLIPAAAKTAVEKARQGHALVYGWMVDYFYRGFESNNIPAGMKVLETYLNDPNCLTSKKMEIKTRLEGMKTLVAGSKAPTIELKDTTGNLFNLYNFNPSSPYVLLLFWSADCNHCIETVDAIFPWLNQSENKQKISVVAISLDETETEIKAWEQKIGKLNNWKNLRAAEGFRSKVAKDYFILATPVMILLDAKTKSIIAVPNTLNEIISSVEYKLQKR